MCGSVAGTAAAPASEMQLRYVYERAHLRARTREHARTHPARAAGAPARYEYRSTHDIKLHGNARRGTQTLMELRAAREELDDDGNCTGQATP